ncbi:epoxide hydrolase family protein [Geodermatophilus sp. SYSU D00691]
MPDHSTPFVVRVPEPDLAELRRRLRATRWPEREVVDDWSQGVPLAWLQELCTYWCEQYDWRRLETGLAEVPQFRTEVDGLGVHHVHVRSPHPGALPLVLTHGWPGSFLEFLDLIGPLTDPVAHGGEAADAFHVVVPSLPGYGFSDKPAGAGWDVERIARAWAVLMRSLGYARYGAAGSDWGTSVSSALAEVDPEHVAGIHLVPPLAAPDPATADDLTDAERRALADADRRARTGSAYSEVHRTAPQTIGYALADSPVALCAWIAEKYRSWADPRTPVDRDRLLDTVSLYWLTGTGASSARLYWHSIDQVTRRLTETGVDVVTAPTGCSVFPAEVPRPSRRWAERRYPGIRFWEEHDRGGHFPALEVPDLLVGDLRAFFRLVRRASPPADTIGR